MQEWRMVNEKAKYSISLSLAESVMAKVSKFDDDGHSKTRELERTYTTSSKQVIENLNQEL